MTTWHIPQPDEGLVAAFTRAIEVCSPDAVAGLSELRVAAMGDNQKRTADVPWQSREPVARALRFVAGELQARADAEGSENPVAGQLRDMADGLLESLARRMAHQL